MVQKQLCPPPDYRQWVILLDGRQALIRPICPADKGAILALFDRLSLETRFLRFHYAKTMLTENELEHYCCVDYHDTLALVAEMNRGGGMEIVGVGWYYRLPGLDSAEVAFVVEDREQGKGVGTHLLKELALMAKGRGITSFVAELTSDNVVMFDIFRKYDPALKQVVEGSSCRVTFSV